MHRIEKAPRTEGTEEKGKGKNGAGPDTSGKRNRGMGSVSLPT